MAGSSQWLINLLPQTAYLATIYGQTRCGKTVFILDLLEGPNRRFFQHIVILLPTARHNKTYQQRPWIWTGPEDYLLDPGKRLHDYLRAFYYVFMGEPTLYIIDDCSASTALTRKRICCQYLLSQDAMHMLCCFFFLFFFANTKKERKKKEKK